MSNLNYPLFSFPAESIPELFQAFLRPVRQQAGNGAAGMDVDITESDNEYVLKAEVPGIAKENISVEIDNNTITIRAKKMRDEEFKSGERVIRQERFWGEYERTIMLAGSVDQAKAKARYENGLLTLTLPKMAGHEDRKIPIE
ncbi:Hsp20/alpha crystallin family protein [Bordetella bronchiseptica]|uniref:Hsp20/alpha crystallin family protein n=1 Tax=Bordetella bronchiseptica TaxID=518 RepID=UPI00045B646F|nr:Hsp20/alpha crystallin family protein [Bordetella bronchiseptica]KCV25662.1 CS domain protein [Bordetella bronchiseptica 00-P-2730]KCV62799.1 CS domain protein [Bordetella bronchiseptica 99-R-0433]